MAYLANRVNDEDRQQSPSQAIQGAGQGVQRQQGTGVQGAGQGAGQGGQNAQGSQGKAPGDFTRSSFTNANTIIGRNRDADTSAITGRLLGDVNQDAANRTQQLDDQGKKYLEEGRTGFQNAYRGPDSATLMQALSGDKDADGKVRAAATRTGVAPVAEVGAKAGELAPTEFFQAQEFTPLLQRRAQGNYTSGMGALDQAVANRSGIGQQVKDQVGALQSGVDRKAADTNKLSEGLQGEAQKFFEGERAALLERIKQKAYEVKGASADRVQGAQRNLDDAQGTARQGAVEQAKAQLKPTLDKLLTQQADLKFYRQSNPELDARIADLQSLMNGGEVLFNGERSGLSRFVTGGQAPKLTAENLVSADEAEDFNQLMGYLGSGESMKAGAMPTAAAAGVDKGNFDSWLNSVLFNTPQKAQAQFEKARSDANPVRVNLPTGSVSGNTGAVGPVARTNPVAATQAPVAAAKKVAAAAVDPRVTAKAQADAAKAAAEKLKEAAGDPGGVASTVGRVFSRKW